MRLDLTSGERRLLAAALGAFGLAHVLAPRLLVRGARVVYDYGLDVRFLAGESTDRRVRLAGLAMLAAAVVWRRVTRI
jgi:hypothetical protein